MAADSREEKGTRNFGWRLGAGFRGAVRELVLCLSHPPFAGPARLVALGLRPGSVHEKSGGAGGARWCRLEDVARALCAGRHFRGQRGAGGDGAQLGRGDWGGSGAQGRELSLAHWGGCFRRRPVCCSYTGNHGHISFLGGFLSRAAVISVSRN